MVATNACLYLSVEQVAARYDVSKDTIWRRRSEGEFPKPIKLGGNASRWRLSDIEEWEAACPSGFVTSLPKCGLVDLASHSLRNAPT